MTTPLTLTPATPGNLYLSSPYPLTALGVFNVKDYGAAGDGVANDTTAIQSALDAAALIGGLVLIPAGHYLYTTLTVDRYVQLVGDGANSSRLSQISGTADVFLKSARSPKTGLQFVVIRDLWFEAFSNTSNTGGIDLEGATFCVIERVQVGYTKNFGIRFKGGSVQGDTMYNGVFDSVFQNGRSGHAVLITCETGGGSHPDGSKIAWNTINNYPSAIKIDAAAIDSVGALAPDSCEIIGNATIECPIALDIAGPTHRVIANRFEVTSGTMAVTVAAGTTNSPTAGVVFIGNSYATHGDPASLLFTDSSVKLTRIGDVEPGNVVVSKQQGVDSRDEIKATRSSSSAAGFSALVSGDTVPRWQVLADGSINLGPGNASADTVIKRGTNNVATTGSGDSFSTNGVISTGGGVEGVYVSASGFIDAARASGTVIFRSYTAGDANPKLQVNIDGKLNWGAGGASAVDTTLYRTAANQLKTDDTLIAADGVATKTKAGTPVDGDFATTPPDGTFVVDTSANKIWVRVGGSWKSVAVS